jgi:hypothetical protein
VRANNWQARRTTEAGEPLQRFEISRSYQFAGLGRTESHATVRAVLTLEGEIVPQGLSLSRKLRFYYWPFPPPSDAEFSMRLMPPAPRSLRTARGAVLRRLVAASLVKSPRTNRVPLIESGVSA